MEEKNRIPTREIIFSCAICLVLAACDIFCFPAGLFINIVVSDITPYIFALMINQWFWIIIGFIAIRLLCPNLKTYISLKYFKNGWKKFWISIVLMVVVSALAFALGLIGKYNYTPSFEKVLVEGLLYYIGVAVLEELYVRVLLLNIIEQFAIKNKNATLIAIIFSSVIFGLGHIPGMLGQGAVVITCRLIFTIALGIYLGILYKESNNLWLPIIVHMLIDFCAVSVCFVSEPIFPISTVVVIALAYLVISLWILYKYNIRKTTNDTITSKVS